MGTNANAGTDIAALMRSEALAHRQAFDTLLARLEQPFIQTLELWESCIRGGGKLLLFGNGGSAADAQHIAAECVIRSHADRAAIAAIALSTDTSALTAGSNDLGFEHVFSRQVEALGRPGDVAVGISTSGRSPNVLNGLAEARRRQLRTTGLSGGDGGSMPALCDAMITVPASATPRIQEMHIFVGHLLCRA